MLFRSALMDARFHQAFGKTDAAIEKYAALAPHGVAGGARPTSAFVEQQYNAYYAQALLRKGDSAAALRLVESQEQIAPQLPSTYSLRIKFLEGQGDRQGVSRARSTAFERFPTCFRFEEVHTVEDRR